MSTWRDKIKSGYIYLLGNGVTGDHNTVDERELHITTGCGGAIEFGEALEKRGFSDELIQESILIGDPEKPDLGMVPLSRITWYKKDI